MLHQTVHAPDPTNRSSTSARNMSGPLLIELGLQDGYLPLPTNHYLIFRPIALGATSEVY